jgi:hypothetical protein
MRLFGRSANQVSTKPPDALDVPPELRPYYREQAVAARTRYAAVRVLATLAVLAVLAGAGTWVWLNHHAIGHTITSRIAAITDQEETIIPVGYKDEPRQPGPEKQKYGCYYGQSASCSAAAARNYAHSIVKR